MKPIATCYVFASDSNPKVEYQTLVYVDGSTSCDCKGWTRRVAPDGSRSCKHTRLCDTGLAASRCVRSVDYSQKRVARVQATPSKPVTFSMPKQGRFVDLGTEAA